MRIFRLTGLINRSIGESPVSHVTLKPEPYKYQGKTVKKQFYSFVQVKVKRKRLKKSRYKNASNSSRNVGPEKFSFYKGKELNASF